MLPVVRRSPDWDPSGPACSADWTRTVEDISSWSAPDGGAAGFGGFRTSAARSSRRVGVEQCTDAGDHAIAVLAITDGAVIVFAEVGGLRRRYERRAA